MIAIEHIAKTHDFILKPEEKILKFLQKETTLE